jgi:hypothetical protein
LGNLALPLSLLRLIGVENVGVTANENELATESTEIKKTAPMTRLRRLLDNLLFNKFTYPDGSIGLAYNVFEHTPGAITFRAGSLGHHSFLDSLTSFFPILGLKFPNSATKHRNSFFRCTGTFPIFPRVNFSRLVKPEN